MSTQQKSAEGISRSLVLIMAVACGVAVANIYYNQPLLPLFAKAFNKTNEEVSLISSMVQAAYAIGLIVFVPLGDIVERRRLIIGLLAFNVLALAGAAMAPSFPLLLIASFCIGFTAVTAQIIIPLASLLAKPEERGKVIGSVWGGLFGGVLLARTLAGIIGEHYGWRTMYWIAAGLDIALAGVVIAKLPHNAPSVSLPYRRLLASLWELFRNEPVLRASCGAAFLLFAAFSAYWGTLAYLLAQPPYGYGPDIAGLFGLVGLVGFFASPYIGVLSDRMGGRRVVALSAILIGIAFIFIANGAAYLWMLLIGIVALDLGSRAGLVGNQTRIYALAPEARSRLNTVFMASYFAGGAIGTKLGAAAGAYGGWRGLGLLGCALAAIVAVSQVLGKKKPALAAS
jgi:predicted MFS family arabinose efflux permease